MDIIALFRQTLGELEEKIKKAPCNLKPRCLIGNMLLDGKKPTEYLRIFENVINDKTSPCPLALSVNTKEPSPCVVPINCVMKILDPVPLHCYRLLCPL